MTVPSSHPTEPTRLFAFHLAFQKSILKLQLSQCHHQMYSKSHFQMTLCCLNNLFDLFSFSSWFTNRTFPSCHLHFLASAWSLSKANEKTFHLNKMGYGISAFFLNTVASVCTCRQNLIHSRASSKISLVFLHLEFSFLAVYRWIFRLSDSMPRCRTKHLRYASSTPLDPPCIPHSERREP